MPRRLHVVRWLVWSLHRLSRVEVLLLFVQRGRRRRRLNDKRDSLLQIRRRQTRAHLLRSVAGNEGASERRACMQRADGAVTNSYDPCLPAADLTVRK